VVTEGKASGEKVEVERVRDRSKRVVKGNFVRVARRSCAFEEKTRRKGMSLIETSWVKKVESKYYKRGGPRVQKKNDLKSDTTLEKAKALKSKASPDLLEDNYSLIQRDRHEEGNRNLRRASR